MGNYPKVFGSFDLQYDVSEFERYKTDLGYYNIDLMPECRVFIFGAEVSADTLSVSTTANTNTIGTCSIQLANPRGRYTIQKSDLCKKWREDKDILSAYNYDFFKKQYPSNILARTFKSAVSSTIGSGIFGVDDTLGKSTRKIFETKFYSGLVKQVGDVVFDYRDPVMVFFKGRFSPYWYFGFTGVISGFDESNQFESDSTIGINCESVLHMWKKQMMIKRSPLLNAGLFEYQSTVRSAKDPATDASWAYSALNYQGTSGLSWNRFVQFVGWGTDSYRSVGNNSLVINNIDKDSTLDITRETQETNSKIAGTAQSNADESNAIDYFLWEAASKDGKGNVNTKNLIRAVYSQCKMSDSTSDKGNHLSSMCSTSLIDLSKGDLLPHPLGRGRTTKAGCNQSSDVDQVEFSAWQGLNLQYIKIAPKVFSKDNELNKYFDASLRMWDKNPKIPLTKDKGSKSSTVTGWQDNQCFAIAGHHPALSYQQVDNFEFITNIWTQIESITKASDGTDTKAIDRLIVSPADKIREIVVGASTSYHCGDGVKQSSSTTTVAPLGVDIYHMTYFRPRLFFLAPRRYNSSKSVNMAQLLNFDLTKAETTSCFDALLDMCNKLDYCMYATPAGDIVVEPYMYDMQPTLFMDSKQYRQYYTDPLAANDYKVQLSDPSLSNYGNLMNGTTINFGERSNHPLSVMNKDLARITQTFDSHQIATSATVQTSFQDDDSSWIAVAAMEQALNDPDLHHKLATIAKENGTQENFSTVGIYIADGINPHLFEKKNDTETKTKLDSADISLKQAVLNSLINNYPTATLKHVLLSVADAIFTPASFINGDTNIQPIPDANLESYKNHNYLFNSYLSGLNTGDFSIDHIANDVDFSNIDMYARVLREIYNHKMWAIKNVYAESLLYLLPAPLSAPTDISNVTTSYTQLSGYYPVFLTSSAKVKSIQSVYEDCNTVYAMILAVCSDLQSRVQTAAANQVAYLTTRLLEYKAQLTIATAALKLARDSYIAGVKYVWDNIDNLIQSDTSANGKSNYESIVLSSFLTNIDPSLLAKSNIKVQNSDLKVSGNDASNLTTIMEILSKKSKDGYSIIQMLMPGSKLQGKSTGVDWATSIYQNFLPIFRDYALLDEDTGSKTDLVREVRKVHEAYTTISNLGSSKSSSVTVRTLADLKDLASQRMYVPKRDLFRMYGYQPAPPKVFMYVNKKDKLDYAMMYLNQYIGQMYRYRIDIIGRPEIQLNRPHFIAYKDCIGLSTGYTTNFSYGSDFSTTLTCNYIRKNSFSYAYSNDYLDVVGRVSQTDSKESSDTGNRRALDCWSNYFAMKKKIDTATKAVQAASDTLMGGSLIGGSLVSNAITSNFSADIRYQNRGLQSLHDTIGHIDFDKKMVEDERPKNMSASFSMLSIYDNDAIRELTARIDTKIKRRDDALAALKSNIGTNNKLEGELASAKNVQKDILNLKMGTKADTYDQIIIGSNADNLYQLTANSYHGLTTEIIHSKLTIKLTSDIKLSDTVDFSTLKIYDLLTPSANSYNTSFSFINRNSGSKLQTSTINVSASTTWQNIFDGFKNMSNVICEAVEGEADGFVSAITIEFEDTIYYNDEVEANCYNSLTTDNGWYLFKNLFGSIVSEPTTSPMYSFILNGVKRDINLTGKPTWGNLVTELSSILQLDITKPTVALAGSEIKIISMKSTVSGKTCNLMTSGSGQDLLSALASRGFKTYVSSGFKTLQRNLNTTISKTISNVQKSAEGLNAERSKNITDAKEASLLLFGYSDVTDSTGSTTVKKLTYDANDNDLKSIIESWSVTYLQNTQSDVAKSARQSYFGQLMIAVYDATKSKSYKLCYIPSVERNKHLTSGNYLTDEVTCYVEKLDDTTSASSADATALKKYVWYSSKGSAKKDTSGSSSVIFNCGCPTEKQYQQYRELTEKLEVSTVDEVIESRAYLADMATGIFVNSGSALMQIDTFLSDWKTSYMSNDEIAINILGYTSKEGEEGYNRELAARRANLFARAFQMGKASKAYGDYIPFGRLGTVDAFGEDPQYRKYNEDNKVVGDNRRVEIELVNVAKVPIDYTVWEDWNN